MRAALPGYCSDVSTLGASRPLAPPIRYKPAGPPRRLAGRNRGARVRPSLAPDRRPLQGCVPMTRRLGLLCLAACAIALVATYLSTRPGARAARLARAMEGIRAEMPPAVGADEETGPAVKE